MRRMRNACAHVCAKICTSSVYEKSRLIPIFYAPREKEQRAIQDVCAKPSCKRLFSFSLYVFLLFCLLALSFNLLHEKCFIVARATAPANLVAFNKLWLHSPSPRHRHCLSSRVVLLGHCVALAFGRRIFCFPFTSSNWIKLPRFRHALFFSFFFCCSDSRVFSAGKRSFRYAIFSLALSLSRALSLPSANSQLCTKLSRKEKIIGHKKCHSKKKKLSNFDAFSARCHAVFFCVKDHRRRQQQQTPSRLLPSARSNANRCDTWTLGCHFKWIRCDNYVSDVWQRSRKVCYESKYVYASWGAPRSASEQLRHTMHAKVDQ